MTRTATTPCRYLSTLTVFLMLSGCVDPSQNAASAPSSVITKELKNTANEQTLSCVIAKAKQYSKTPGSPFELGSLAANACESYINASAKAYADGNPRVEAMNRQNFKQTMAENAAQMIVELRTR